MSQAVNALESEMLRFVDETATRTQVGEESVVAALATAQAALRETAQNATVSLVKREAEKRHPADEDEVGNKAAPK
ncbi:hypothetical protein AGDE_14955 [Angomonas deanei]|uniref:Uncharacterized protein n=1 Tax=Angomonas deanei TaxID=59799 RepID=A0A7G2C8Q7_9TRYP|nr:hypothetical protein AGDE_14955 [Angomonas deanei]CAD2215825.1 hypothetical protein, conserved [Angomonas deanei]|eukprot:EPY19928.1 hypothetical protein AGDE_14955 [Angomonas deanei]